MSSYNPGFQVSRSYLGNALGAGWGLLALTRSPRHIFLFDSSYIKSTLGSLHSNISNHFHSEAID